MLNAEAVKVNFDRRMDPEAAVSETLLENHIKEVSVVDEYTLKIEAKYPFAPMVAALTHLWNRIQSPKALKASWTEPMEKPVGTGPFIWKEWVPGDHITLVRNEDYWGEKPALEEIVFKIIPDDAARVIALETGEIDICYNLPPMDALRLEGNPDIDVFRGPSQRTMHIGLNVTKGPLNDKRVRQAMNYAVNKQAIIDTILGGAGRVSDAPIAPGIFGYVSTKTYEYDLEKAKALLTEAGYPDGFEIMFYPAVGRYLMDVSVATAVAADLLKVGVKCKVIMKDWASMITALVTLPEDEADQEMYLIGIGPGFGDADYVTALSFQSDMAPPTFLNCGFYKNEKVDELLEAARREADPVARVNLYKEMDEIIMDECPWIFMYVQGQVHGWRANVKGVSVHTRELINLRQIWIE